MESQTNRQRKTAILITGVLALVLVAGFTVAFNATNRAQVGADVTSNTALDSNLANNSLNVLVKTVDSAGAAKAAFLDAIIDTNSNCTIDSDEVDGYSGETGADGTATLALPAGQAYVLRATNQAGVGEGSVTVALGNASSAACMTVVKTANTTPINITIK